MTATEGRIFALLMLATALGHFAPTAPRADLEARQLQIVDDQGRVRATFGIGPTGEPGLWLVTAEGEPRAALAMRAPTDSNDRGVSLSLMNQHGKTAAFIGNFESEFHGDSQEFYLMAGGESADISLSTGRMNSGPELILRDERDREFFSVRGGPGGFQPEVRVTMPEIEAGQPFGPQKKGGAYVALKPSVSEGRSLQVRAWSGKVERELEFD